jgi:hypothetical protein
MPPLGFTNHKITSIFTIEMHFFYILPTSALLYFCTLTLGWHGWTCN